MGYFSWFFGLMGKRKTKVRTRTAATRRAPRAGDGRSRAEPNRQPRQPRGTNAEPADTFVFIRSPPLPRPPSLRVTR